MPVLSQETGAFTNAYLLTSIKLPSTLRSIGRYSFKNTNLTFVRLPATCTYYSTSFPDNCRISGGVLIE